MNWYIKHSDDSLYHASDRKIKSPTWRRSLTTAGNDERLKYLDKISTAIDRLEQVNVDRKAANARMNQDATSAKAYEDLQKRRYKAATAGSLDEADANRRYLSKLRQQAAVIMTDVGLKSSDINSILRKVDSHFGDDESSYPPSYYISDVVKVLENKYRELDN